MGTLSSGDKKNITICAVIDDKKSPIYAEFENLSDPLKEKITKKTVDAAKSLSAAFQGYRSIEIYS